MLSCILTKVLQNTKNSTLNLAAAKEHRHIAQTITQTLHASIHRPDTHTTYIAIPFHNRKLETLKFSHFVYATQFKQHIPEHTHIPKPSTRLTYKNDKPIPHEQHDT